MSEVPKALLWRYVVAGCLTLAYQIWLRWDLCAGATACGISVAKGMVWSITWPLYWIAYFAGVL